MKRALLLGFLALVMAVPGIALADWSENFDSYALGSGLHGQGGWHGWDGSPTWDAYVSNAYSRSSPHSVSATLTTDIVQEYSGYTSGVWVFTAWQYVPTGFSGTSYLILLNTYNNGGPYSWSTQIAFTSSTMTVVSDPDGANLPLLTGRWVEIRIVIDLNQDLQTIYYDNQILDQKSWSGGVPPPGVVNIGGLDLFANGASPIYYDDLSLVADNPTPIENTSWGRIKQTYRQTP